MDLDPKSRRVRLQAFRLGVSVDGVVKATGFEPPLQTISKCSGRRDLRS